MRYDVVETFVSINGEGLFAGCPAMFIRFRKCNLRCSYCDTAWAQTENAYAAEMTETDIYEKVRESGVKYVTLTGGEPLLRDGMDVLCKKLLGIEGLRIEIETNGSVALDEINKIRANAPERVSFTMDYKLPLSLMEDRMCVENFALLCETDCVKFVCAGREDLEKAVYIIKKYNTGDRFRTIFSPVFGKIEPVEIVDFILENKLMDSRMQLQLHKFIWDPERRGV